jgi:hypothetical protein
MFRHQQRVFPGSGRRDSKKIYEIFTLSYNVDYSYYYFTLWFSIDLPPDNGLHKFFLIEKSANYENPESN